jgi:dTDP-glucose 4,6-dehydratase
VISNCSNNYGPKQHDEKLIPTIIRNALSNKPIPIYGTGKNIRDWLYVTDHCSALDRIFHNGIIGESYNVGAHNEKTNIDIAILICQILDKLKPLNGRSYSNQISYVTDRLGHDFRYAIDNTKICQNLNWKSSNSFNKTLEDTVKWYIDYYAL